jgi:hypothetical protein
MNLDDVPGWFYRQDALLFDCLLGGQREIGVAGDILEMGSYLGRSTIFMARYLAPEEELTVCDLFGESLPGDDMNISENRATYEELTRQGFESNFLQFYDRLPRIVQAPTSVLPDEVEAGSCRFVHIDASHLYHNVKTDIGNARDLLLPENGLVALDDVNSFWMPQVGAATWEAVFTAGLKPICLSRMKFYGTWGDPGIWHERVEKYFANSTESRLETNLVAGHKIISVI